MHLASTSYYFVTFYKFAAFFPVVWVSSINSTDDSENWLTFCDMTYSFCYISDLWRRFHFHGWTLSCLNT